MAPSPSLAYTFIVLSISHVALGNDDAVMPWSSSQTGDSFTCEFGHPNGIVSGSPFCYLPENPEPIMAYSENLFLVRNGVVHGQKSAVWPNGTVVVSLDPVLARRPCVMCQWFHKNVRQQTCLACRGTTVNRARHNDRRRVATLLSAEAMIVGSVRYFICRFRIPRNITGGQTAWLNDRCLSSDGRKDTNPMDSCSLSRTHLPLYRSGPNMVMQARVLTEETCRVCMVQINGALTVGRACLDAQMDILLRDVKIGRLLVLGIWMTSLIVVVGAITRFIYNTELVQGCFKRAIMVRMNGSRLAVLACLWVTTTSGAVTISVLDTYVPELVRVEHVILTGLELCLGPAVREREEMLELLDR